MSINISSKLSKNKTIVRYYFEWSKGAGQHVSSGVFTYSKPNNLFCTQAFYRVGHGRPDGLVANGYNCNGNR